MQDTVLVVVAPLHPAVEEVVLGVLEL